MLIFLMQLKNNFENKVQSFIQITSGGWPSLTKTELEASLDRVKIILSPEVGEVNLHSPPPPLKSGGSHTPPLIEGVVHGYPH